MMRDDMVLPAVQRDALIERVAWGIAQSCSHDPDLTLSDKGCGCTACNGLARAALAAIEEQYVLIPKDQVTVERRRCGEFVSPRREPCLVLTDWKEHDDPTG